MENRTYRAIITINTEDATEGRVSRGLTERELERVRQAIRDNVPRGSTVRIKVAEE